MVKFKNVSKTFGDIVALKDVTFEVEKGEFVFITGPSGAGKTTLLRLLLGEYLPDSGQILVDGVDITKLPRNKLPFYRQKVGTIFQDFKVLPERTVKENVEIALAVLGVNPSEWDARVYQVLKLVGLAERALLFPAQLSGGELQRVSLARALVVNPHIILADEPTGNLDWETADSIMDLLDKINFEGKTVIMATHNKLILDKHERVLGDGKIKRRIIKMKEGKLVESEKEKKVKVKVIEEKQ